MKLNSLTAISPIDGRYFAKTEKLNSKFSEFALMKYRLHIEIEYLIFLSEQQFFTLPIQAKNKLRKIIVDFSLTDAKKIKKIEIQTNHDVKAIELYLRQMLVQLKLESVKEWVHFGLTSQDINNTAIPLLWKETLQFTYEPLLNSLIYQLTNLSKQAKKIPMLARTHGQPASPTMLGKEIFVFVERLQMQLILLKQIPFTAKFGGATGNFNAHHVAFKKFNWKKFGDNFLKKINLIRQQNTTQIEHYDNLSAQFDALKRINTILIDFSRDVWSYISLEYFSQKITTGEVGSSAMPHKVNPIDFENAEGNLGIANALFEHFAAKLPISRLQRDLTDSTVLRNIGVPFAHTIIAIHSLEKGISKLIINRPKIKKDLDNNWAVIAEAIQTILRRENYKEPYLALKNLTRGNKQITKEILHNFIQSLKVSNSIKNELKLISPHNYTGV